MEFQVSPGSVFHDDQRIQRQNGGLPENSTVTTFKYVEGRPNREAPEVV